MNSIIQSEKQCYLCGRQFGLEKHHIYAGLANRKISEREGLWVWLCNECHTGTEGAQYNKEKSLLLKQTGQQAFEKFHTREEWMSLFRKNYL